MRPMNGLSNKQLIGLRQRLKIREQAIQAAMHQDFLRRHAALAEGARYHESGDEEAGANALNDAEVLAVGNYRMALQAIDDSVARITAGSYGLCADCGRHIGIRRLLANPAETRCLTCQARRARTGTAPAAASSAVARHAG